jgi:cytochrome P450
VSSSTPVTVPSAPFPLQANASVFADFITASRDPARFPDPEAIKLDRPYSDYIHHGWGPHSCLGRPIVETAAAAMLRQLARECRGPRRAAGDAGEMKRKLFNGAIPVFLAQNGGDWESFPVGE